MKYHEIDITLQEVPNEVSLTISIAGCPYGCKGCFWDPIKESNCPELNTDDMLFLLNRYLGRATCVTFLGGEWEEETLIKYLKMAKKTGYKTCLYTGKHGTIESITEHLDFIKEGPWIEELGGLTSPKTNQRFYKMPERTDLTHLFRTGE